MKTRIYYLFLPFLAFMFSCDDFDRDEQLEYLGENVNMSTPLTVSQTEQYVLLEDFTGWNCPNCPKGTEEINSIISQYGDRIVVAAVHAGAFARPKPDNNNLDLRTDYGEKLLKKYGILSFPSLMVMRNGETSSTPSAWKGKVEEFLNSSEHDANISLGVDVFNDTLLVSTQVELLNDADGDLFLTLYVVEDGIVGIQNDNGTIKNDYVFNHVLRNGVKEDMPLSYEPLQKGDKVSKNYIMKTDAGWIIDNCKLVAILTKSNGNVIQVNQIEING